MSTTEKDNPDINISKEQNTDFTSRTQDAKYMCYSDEV